MTLAVPTVRRNERRISRAAAAMRTAVYHARHLEAARCLALGDSRREPSAPRFPLSPRCVPASAAADASGPPDPPCRPGASAPTADSRSSGWCQTAGTARDGLPLAAREQHHTLMPLRHDRLLRPRHPSPSPNGPGHRCRSLQSIQICRDDQVCMTLPWSGQSRANSSLKPNSPLAGKIQGILLVQA